MRRGRKPMKEELEELVSEIIRKKFEDTTAEESTMIREYPNMLVNESKSVKRIKTRVEGWIVKNVQTRENEITTLLIRKMKKEDNILVDKWRNARYIITTPPILVNYNVLGIPCTKEVYLCDDKTGVTMNIDIQNIDNPEKKVKWRLTSHLLSDMLDLSVFSQIMKQLKSPSISILYLLLGLMGGLLIGIMFL